MPTSSITRNFVISGKEQVEKFANAIEESYQESLTREKSDMHVTILRGEELREFMKKKRNSTEIRIVQRIRNIYLIKEPGTPLLDADHAEP